MKYFRIPHLELLIGPPIIWALGFFMNACAVAANGGQMPVEYPGGCAVMKAADADPVKTLFGGADIIHSCMTHTTHVKFLCDWVYNSGAVWSPGDFLISAGDLGMTFGFFLWIAWMVRDHWHANSETPWRR